MVRYSGKVAVTGISIPLGAPVEAVPPSKNFIDDLIATMDALPMEPVVPIDWKLNLALMRMFDDGRLVAGDCWQVEPGPIDQLSMRTEASA